MDWSDHINTTLLDIDGWFGEHGDTIPEVPRAELERHLRLLSEQIHGYSGFLGGRDGRVRWLDAEPGPIPGFTPVGMSTYEDVPVHTFGHDAELAQRAMLRRDGEDAAWLAMVVIWVIVAIGIAVFLLSDWSPARADQEHMDKYHTDPQYDQWFRSLRGPASEAFPGGIDCCNLNDCERVEAEWRQRPDGQWAWFASLPQRAGAWHEVPADRIVKDKPSIDGEAYACVNKANLQGSPIRCFVPAIPGF